MKDASSSYIWVKIWSFAGAGKTRIAFEVILCM
jgi:hypothetical protein